MRKEDFKFNPMFAFEEGYLEKQRNLPPAERDRVRRKYDFSGDFSGTKSAAMRAEDVVIVRELLTALQNPLAGPADATRRGDGWGTYVRNDVGFGLWFGPGWSNKEREEAFGGDKTYRRPDGTEVNGIPGGPVAAFAARYERPDGVLEDLDMSKSKPADLEERAVAVLPYATVDRRDPTFLLLAAVGSFASPEFADPSYDDITEYADRSPTSKTSLSWWISKYVGDQTTYRTAPLPGEAFVTESFATTPHAAHEYEGFEDFASGLSAMRYARPAGSLMHALPDLWKTLKVDEATKEHPRPSAYALDAVYESVRDVDFYTVFRPSTADPDRALGGNVGIRFASSPGGDDMTSGKTFAVREAWTTGPECDSDEPPRTCVTTWHAPEETDVERSDGLPRWDGRRTIHHWSGYSSVASHTDDGIYYSTEYVGHLTKVFAASGGTRDGGFVEVTLPADIARCVHVLEVALLVFGQGYRADHETLKNGERRETKIYYKSMFRRVVMQFAGKNARGEPTYVIPVSTLYGIADSSTLDAGGGEFRMGFDNDTFSFGDMVEIHFSISA